MISPVILYLIVSACVGAQTFDWRRGEDGIMWAYGCDFPIDDIGGVSMPDSGANCGHVCHVHPGDSGVNNLPFNIIDKSVDTIQP